MSDERTEEHEHHDHHDEHHHHDDHCDHKHHRHGHGAQMMAGPVWVIGWLFTIGYLHPTFWKAVLGIIIWPYYLGNYLSMH
jgi:hypothetical protein